MSVGFKVSRLVGQGVCISVDWYVNGLVGQ